MIEWTKQRRQSQYTLMKNISTREPWAFLQINSPHHMIEHPVNTVYLKFIHHLADSTSFLPNDIAVKIKGHLYLDGDGHQGLEGQW